MNVTYEVQGQTFEWDSEKAASNLSKHQISFERASEVFFDPFVVLVDANDDEEEDEAREAAIGLTEDWTLLFVVHVIRREDTIRIISAHPATPSERSEYEDV
ncbi:MAG: BrnT family toxin [Planctomycetota bacterium]